MVIYKLFNAKGVEVARLQHKPSKGDMRRYNAVSFKPLYIEGSTRKRYKAPEYMLHF